MVKYIKVYQVVFYIFLSFTSMGQTLEEDNDTTMFLPNVIKLDIDDFKFISHGIIGIIKQNKEALIDVKGNFIVPWGKYIYKVSGSPTWGDLIWVQDPLTGNEGYINYNGKIIINLSQVLITSTGFNHFNLCNVRTYSSGSAYVIDVKGNKSLRNDVNYHFGSPTFLREPYNSKQNFNKMLIARSIIGNSFFMEFSGSVNKNAYPDQNHEIGYGNKFGKITLKANYDLIREFTNERAAVMKIDEFNIGKWGFIDTSGKLVIPCMFKNEPGYFHNGLALVEPADKNNFQYAYIDQQGAIKIKIGDDNKNNFFEPINEDKENKTRMLNNDWVTSLPECGYFINGYSFWKKNAEAIILDTAGKIYTLNEFINNPVIPKDKTGLVLKKYDEKGIYFLSSNLFGRNNMGLIDYKRNLLFFPNYDDIIPDFYSSYAIASYFFSNEKPKYGFILKGVINKEGKYIIIKEKKEPW